MKTAIFDLDGTLYSGSTLKDYFIFGILLLLRKRKFPDAAKIMVKSMLTKIGVYPHVQVKYNICRKLRAELTAEDYNKFLNKLLRKINPAVLKLFDQFREQDYKIILSTASPAEYCVALGNVLGVDSVISTPLTENEADYIENRGEEKLKSLKGLRDTVVNIVVTDHYDDLPLMRAAEEKVILVNPNSITLKKVDNEKIKYQILTSET